MWDAQINDTIRTRMGQDIVRGQYYDENVRMHRLDIGQRDSHAYIQSDRREPKRKIFFPTKVSFEYMRSYSVPVWATIIVRLRRCVLQSILWLR